MIVCSSAWHSSGFSFSAIMNSVVPSKNDAMFNGPRHTANRSPCPTLSMCPRACVSRRSISGNSPSVRGFGRAVSPNGCSQFSVLSANGRSFSRHTHFAPNADGSVHIPNSDQNPGKTARFGNRFVARRFASSHIASDA